MRIHGYVALAAVALSLGNAQNLTSEQRKSDLQQLANLFAKHYGPYEWKKEVKNFDLYNLKPWLDRAETTTDDLEFADLLVEWVASLDDAHDAISFPSNWAASLGFSVDYYDDKLLIEAISRARLPLAQYPFGIGDELVSIDGVPVADAVARYRKYAIAANERSTRRFAASLLTSRRQAGIPLAPRWTPDKSMVEIRRASGDLESYELTWLKTGTEMEFGLLPSPARVQAKAARKLAYSQVADSEDPTLPDFMKPMASKLNIQVNPEWRAILNYGGRNPIFTPPANFQRRLGGLATDIFFSGTFESGGKRIGFLRIPSFSPSNTSLAVNQFAGEIIFFQQNTDGLIIDDMRNPGGSVSYCEFLLTLLMPNTFRTLGFEIRATSSWVNSMSSTVQAAEAAGLPGWQLDGLRATLEDIRLANRGNRARTGPLSLNSSGTLDLLPGPILYTKPLIVLVDELSASGGDFFPAVIQDNNRGLIVGMRTMGAGGNVVPYDASSYTEGFVTITESLMNRKNPVTGTEFPAAPYVENIGVRPDVVVDYMTRENLMNGGAPFVSRISQIMVDHINAAGSR
jgi:hypothetical protein